MTKTLTEQWREGELFGFHYVKVPKEEPTIHNVSCMDYLLDEYGVEVLAPVPSYDEYQDIIQQNVNQESAIETYIEDIKRLQEQISEANEVIKKYAYPKSVCKSIIENQMVCEVIAYTEPKEGLDYLEKWGLK